ncbi:ParB/RepB/Spo0J family partition protein [Cereibacter sphaeroides]|uniref:ParB/RepB/Spo0J family partition protein n=1 Tax=Cereibacter sphaeroides TaxID=1063 RepID=UPI001F3D69BC|nr:ParB/RepB/Spo0J family partition protein [Cereibacter sphaeroides]MCE6967509.1 ParB/RepB/Spo0J family partition protein [Cereibacter sphaeroides]
MDLKKKVSSTTATLERLKQSGQLDALKRPKAPAAAGPQEIPLDQIVPDPDQPRRSFDPDKLRALADSITAQGVLQAITVRPADESGKHMIIMGERRYQAAKLAGLEKIPAVVREATSAIRLAQLTENVQRDDLTTLEIARAVLAMREAGQSREDIAKALGWSEGNVSRFASINKMPEELQQLAAANVPVRAIADLHGLWKRDDEAVRAFLARTKVENVSRSTVEVLRDAIESGNSEAGTMPSGETSALGAEGDAAASGVVEGPSGQVAEDLLSEASEGVGKRAGKGRGVVIVCKVGDAVGRLDLAAVPGRPKCVVVRFDGGERIEEIPLNEIELVDVVPL